MIKLRQATIEDMAVLAANAVDETLAGRGDYVRQWAKYDIEHGPAFAAVYEGRAVAVAGIRIVRPGVGMIWIIMSREVEKYSFSFMKDALYAMKTMTNILIGKYGLKKVRAVSRIGFGPSQRLLEHLGFERARRHTKTHYLYLLRS